MAEVEEWEKVDRRQAWFNEHPLKHRKKEYRKPKPRPVSPYTDKLIAYMKGRGISEETMKAMKITEGIEKMPRKNGTFTDTNTIQFNYYKEGELVNTKFRTGDKCFKMVTGAELLPYNVDSIKNETTCIITEGEMDTLSFYEAGFKNVVSVPAGANSNLEWLDDYQEEYFDNKECIFIASDNDTKGVELQAELLRRFGVERCKVVEYGPGCKDANDHLQKYGKESLRDCIANAREVKLEGVFTIPDIEPQLDGLYRTGLQPGKSIGHPSFDGLCTFDVGMLVIITGIPNHGKSEWLDEMIYRLNLRHKWKFAYFSPENEPMAFHASKLIEKFVGKRFHKDTMSLNEYTYAKRHLMDNFFFICPEENFLIDTILAKAKALVRRNGIKGLVIDPYNYIEDDRGSNETDYVSKLLSKLKTFAKVHQVLIFLVAHPKKLTKNKEGLYEAPDLYDISGSAHFYNKADYGISVMRHFGVEEFVDVNVLKVRFKHLGHRGTAKFKYNVTNGRYVPYTEGLEPVWDNTNHLLAQDIESQVASMDNAKLDFDEFEPTDEDIF